MRCHHVYDEIAGRVLIPGCMAAAVYGIHRCTCYEKVRYNTKNEEMKQMQEEIEALTSTIQQLEEENRELYKKIKKK